MQTNDYAMIDAIVVRAHQHSSGAKGDAYAPAIRGYDADRRIME